MCGLAGYIDFNQQTSKDILSVMTSTLSHRGPDDQGLEVVSMREYSAGFGHQRLSIIDLSSNGHQPMTTGQGDYIIVLNGEIYNYQEIREELIQKGHTFSSTSDTEVALKALIEWGMKAVEKFTGMFAIVFANIKQNKIYLLRDRAGVKPLYYYFHDGLFLFGSELKPLMAHPKYRREIDLTSLGTYFTDGYITSPNTIFRNTYKVSPGEIVSLNLSTKEINKKTYWSVIDAYNAEKLDISLEEAAEELEVILKKAFNYRMIADVPVGVFLSGGYDSSTLTAILQSQLQNPVRTFTIGFHDKKFNEARYAKEVAEYLGTNHTEVYCSPDDALSFIPRHPEIYDEPFGDSSALPTTLLSQITRQEVKVSLSSDGGDELFGGYVKYSRALNFHRNTAFLPHTIKQMTAGLLQTMAPLAIPLMPGAYNFRTRYHKITEMLKASSISDVMRIGNRFFSAHELQDLLKNTQKVSDAGFSEHNLLNEKNDLFARMQAIDYKTYLADDILCKVDRASMSVGLEGRDPYLDHRIIEYASRLPTAFKRDNGHDKIILKHITHKYLPVTMMNRPKMGFEVPLGNWFRGKLKDLVIDTLSPETLDPEIFNVKGIVKFRDDFLRGKNENPQKLWLILAFQLWYDQWMSGKN